MTFFLYWFVWFPVIFILRVLFIWLPPLWQRRVFENRNSTEPGCRSFETTLEKADLCFEFSSEGEYQQVASIIDDALKESKRVELVFFSPSVEKTIRELYEKNPAYVRYYRYPIVTFLPWHSFSTWMTSKELILVRYDFFPEFLLWAKQSGHRLKIVWMTFKKERSKNSSPSFYKKLFLHASKFTVFATEADLKLAQKLGFVGVSYDFRLEQIRRRVERKSEKFSASFPEYDELKKVLALYPENKRLILGNAWDVDMELLKNIAQDVIVIVVPHKLDEKNLSAITEKIREAGRTPLEIKNSWPGPGNTYVLNKKGVLCELYGDFGKSYVGGGFGVSVHSLLEPLVSGSALISCGPVHHRSTEFDVAETLGAMNEVKNADDFGRWASLELPTVNSRDKMKNVFDQYPKLMREVLIC